jgi:hypothetical protein
MDKHYKQNALLLYDRRAMNAAKLLPSLIHVLVITYLHANISI